MNTLARAGQDAADFLRQRPTLVLVPAAIAVGALLVMPVPEVAILAVLAAVPVALVEIAILRDLFLGVALYLVFEYLQPGQRISGLSAIRPTFLVATALGGAWILNVARHRVPVVINWQVKSYLILGILGSLSAFNAISVGRAGLTLFALAKTLLVFWIMFSVITNLERLQRLVWLYVIIHFTLAAAGLALFATTGQRRFGDVGSGFIGDENDSAMALLIMIPYSYFLLQKARRPLVRVFLIGGMIMSSFTVLYSFSRGAFVGFTAMVIYLWWRSAHKFRSGLLLAAAVLAIFAVMPPAYWQRIQSVKEYSTEGSAQGRLDAWKGGFKMMRDSPLLGCGIGNFSRAYGTQYNTINTRWTAAHSMYIEFIGQLGVPGILFILATIVLTLRTFRRTRQISRRYRGQEFRSLETIMLGAECGFVSYLVATFFLSSMTYPHLWHFGAMSGFGLQIVKRLRQQVGSPLPTG